MNNINLVPAYPEIFLLIAASAILLIDMFLRDGRRHITYLLTLTTLGICGLLTLQSMQAGGTVYTFHNMFVSDPMSNLLKLCSYVAMAFTLIYSRRYSQYRGMLGDSLGGEFYVIALFALLGQMVMISATNLLSLYLGLELMSLALYTLVALRRDHSPSIEAAMKYFILGALASGFLLYGMSMVYGSTNGLLGLEEIYRAAVEGRANRIGMVFGLVFIVAGLAFKLGAVPFHMWVPDVYQGAPTSVTLLIGGAPKLAAFAIFIRLLVEGMFPMAVDWQQMLIILGVASLVVGNLAAIAQTNIKRMLAFSTIAQMGFVLFGLACGVADPGSQVRVSDEGYGAAMFYMITYVLATLGTFGMVMLLSRTGFEAENLNDFKGLNQRSPWFAFIMLILMFSLAGIPPMAGFYAKFAVLQALMGAYHWGLTVFAVLASLVAAFYYLRVVKLMYFDKAEDKEAIVVNLDMRIALSVNGLAVLVIGLMPDGLMLECADAIRKTLMS